MKLSLGCGALALMCASLCSGSVAPATAAADALPLERPATVVRRPASSALLSLSRAGKRLVAVGERGLVVISDDEGRQWAQVPSPTSVTLTAVVFADAQRGWATGHGALVMQTTDGGRSWARQFDGRELSRQAAAADASGGAVAKILSEPLPDKAIFDVAFADAKYGYAVGSNGMYLRTRDGGASWQLQTHALQNPKALHLYAISVRSGRIVIAGEQGRVHLSTDGGDSFQAMDVPYRGSIFRVEVTASGTILAAGLQGNLITSPDAGKSWVTIKLPTDSPLTALQLSDGDVALVGALSGQLFSYRLGDARGRSVPHRAAAMLSSVLLLDGESALTAGLSGIGTVSYER